MKDVNEFRNMSVDEIDATYNDKCRELFHLKNSLRQEKKLEKPHLLNHTKKEIARLLTVRREKQGAK